jgi:hypothetical protein
MFKTKCGNCKIQVGSQFIVKVNQEIVKFVQMGKNGLNMI